MENLLGDGCAVPLDEFGEAGGELGVVHHEEHPTPQPFWVAEQFPLSDPCWFISPKIA